MKQDGGNQVLAANRKIRRSFILLAAAVLLFGQTVSADVENGLLITGFSYESKIYAGESTRLVVEVLQVQVENGERGKPVEYAPEENAIVTVDASNGNKELQLTLNHEKEGKYGGQIKFPEPGNWRLLATAKDPEGPGEAPDENFEAQLVVIEPKSVPSYVWVILFAVLAGSIWSIVRKRAKKDSGV